MTEWLEVLWRLRIEVPELRSSPMRTAALALSGLGILPPPAAPVLSVEWEWDLLLLELLDLRNCWLLSRSFQTFSKKLRLEEERG